MKIIKTPSGTKIVPTKVVPITAKGKPDSRKASERKFGKPVMDLGFCIVPSLLMLGAGTAGHQPSPV